MIRNWLAMAALASLQILLHAASPCHAGDSDAAIRVNVGFVEVCVTVRDARGRYVEGLSKESFRVYDEGEPQRIASFQDFERELTCTIVLDTTGSMRTCLPVIKNAVMQLIDRLRPGDLFGVYSFNSSVRLVQDFTRDKPAAKRAVLRLQAGGATALYDTIAEVSRGLEDRKGKVAVVVFTDGNDNVSLLTLSSAVERVRGMGMPLYVVAQGEALQDSKLLDQLHLLTKTTGGACYAIRRSSEVEKVFSDISQDLRNTYMLAYYAPSAETSTWRRIRVEIPALKDATIRSRDGYVPRTQNRKSLLNGYLP
jgi:Ca-activated chloride channel family protein